MDADVPIDLLKGISKVLNFIYSTDSIYSTIHPYGVKWSFSKSDDPATDNAPLQGENTF